MRSLLVFNINNNYVDCYRGFDIIMRVIRINIIAMYLLDTILRVT